MDKRNLFNIHKLHKEIIQFLILYNEYSTLKVIDQSLNKIINVKSDIN